jgi:hypothetical protein
MSKRKKTILSVLVLLIGLPIAELIREEIAYLIVSRRIKAAYERTEIGMTKEEVKKLADDPDSVTARANEEIWYWDARHHQGALWNLLGIVWVKGHYTFITAFDENGKVGQKWGGVN